jgi:hypothetical protein
MPPCIAVLQALSISFSGTVIGMTSAHVIGICTVIDIGICTLSMQQSTTPLQQYQ